MIVIPHAKELSIEQPQELLQKEIPEVLEVTVQEPLQVELPSQTLEPPSFATEIHVETPQDMKDKTIIPEPMELPVVLEELLIEELPKEEPLPSQVPETPLNVKNTQEEPSKHEEAMHNGQLTMENENPVKSMQENEKEILNQNLEKESSSITESLQEQEAIADIEVLPVMEEMPEPQVEFMQGEVPLTIATEDDKTPKKRSRKKKSDANLQLSKELIKEDPQPTAEKVVQSIF